MAKNDPKGREIARIWGAGGKQYVSLASGLWNDAAAWGIMLVDLANHVAAAYAQSRGDYPGHVLARIKQGFDAEWSNATDEPTGSLLDSSPTAEH
jgi:hypothetical protein